MAFLKYFSHDTSVPKQSLSLPQKEKEVVSDFVSEAEKGFLARGRDTVYTVKMQYLIPLPKKTSEFLVKPHNIIPANITRHRISYLAYFG